MPGNFHLFMGADDMLRSLTTEMGLPPLGAIKVPVLCLFVPELVLWFPNRLFG